MSVTSVTSVMSVGYGETIVTDRVVVIGAGGHAIDLLDCIRRINQQGQQLIDVAGLLADVSPSERNATRLSVLGIEVLGSLDDIDSIGVDRFVVAVGYPAQREQAVRRLGVTTSLPLTLVDPGVVLSPHCEIGAGTVLLGPSRISEFAIVGEHALVSYGCAVGHGSAIGSFTSVMPGVIIGGEARIGSGVLIGAGAIVLEDVCVGDAAIIGAGAVVTTDVTARTTVVGIPARSARS